MGVLSLAKIGYGQEAYYLATVARRDPGAREPGTGHQSLVEPDGLWMGEAAGILGLCAPVEHASLHAVLHGVDPATGELLSTAHGAGRVRIAGFDCTLSAPKSVSLLHALGAPEVTAQVRAAHEAACRSTLSYLERSAARVRRSLGRRTPPAGEVGMHRDRARKSVGEAGSPRRSDSQVVEIADGFVAASFLHRTSRAPDPHLHSHIVIANLAPDHSRHWSALDARALYLELGTASRLYQAALRAELSDRLGVAFGPLRRGAFADLVGFDQATLRAFSRRAAEIEEAMAAGGFTSPAAARVAQRQTRRPKDLTVSYETLVEAWREQSYGLGCTASRIARAAPGPRLAGRSDPRISMTALEELAAQSPRASFNRRDLLRALCASAPDGASIETIEAAATVLLGSSDVRSLPVRSFDAPVLGARSKARVPTGVVEQRYTTPGMLATEAALLSAIEAGRGALVGGGDRVALAVCDGGGILETAGSVVSSAWYHRSTPGRSDHAHTRAVVAGSPGRARAFEALTGIESYTRQAVLKKLGTTGETRILAGLVGDGDSPGGLVVVDAHHFLLGELASLVEASERAGSPLLLVAPRSVVLGGRAPSIAAVAGLLGHPITPPTAELAYTRSPSVPTPSVPVLSVPVGPVPVGREGTDLESETVLAEDPLSWPHERRAERASSPLYCEYSERASVELYRRAEDLVARVLDAREKEGERGHKVVVVADDRSLAVAMTGIVTPAPSGKGASSPPVAVLTSRDLDGVATRLDGATVFAIGTGHLSSTGDLVLRHLAVGRPGSIAEYRVQAAEIAPPSEIGALLGDLPPDPLGRGQWRRAAGAILAYRDRYAEAPRLGQRDASSLEGGLDSSRVTRDVASGRPRRSGQAADLLAVESLVRAVRSRSAERPGPELGRAR